MRHKSQQKQSATRKESMETYELFIEPVRRERDATGRYMPGHTPFTKGRSQKDYMSEEGRRKALANLRLPHRRSGGVPLKAIVGVTDDGRLAPWGTTTEAAGALGCNPGNIRRCCRKNAHGGDYHYFGFRWYHEDNKAWSGKIGQAQAQRYKKRTN